MDTLAQKGCRPLPANSEVVSLGEAPLYVEPLPRPNRNLNEGVKNLVSIPPWIESDPSDHQLGAPWYNCAFFFTISYVSSGAPATYQRRSVNLYLVPDLLISCVG